MKHIHGQNEHTVVPSTDSDRGAVKVARGVTGGRVLARACIFIVDLQSLTARSDGDDNNRQHNTAATDGEQRNRYGKGNVWQRSRSICNNKLTGGSTSAAQCTQNASQQCSSSSNCGQINRHITLIIHKVMNEKVTLNYGKWV